jgi:proline iminopeptidase
MTVPGQHRVFYEQCGNPDGMPVVFLHGGPGSGCNPSQRRFFDPQHYRIILIDQRGCGRSLPLGEINENTTQHLVEDIEQLRKQLGITRWLVFGGSWGSTLALAYATVFPHTVSGLILRGIFLSQPSELEWFLYSVRHFFPEAWFTLVDPLPKNKRNDIMRTYYQWVFSGDAEAAHRWNNFEGSIMHLIPSGKTNEPPSDSLALARARVQLHYLTNHCFLDQRPLLDRIDAIRNIPGIIIQGRYDMVCPPVTAESLHRAWPEADYVIIPDAGHSAMEPGITAALVSATESFKRYR